jgi:predicted GNAT family acetyltransferase
VEVLLLRYAPRFAKRAASWLTGDPFTTNVIGTWLDGAQTGARPQSPEALWILVMEGGSVVGAAMHTPPHPVFLPRLPSGAASTIATALSQNGRAVPGVDGEKRSVTEFVLAWTARTGVTPQLRMALRMYRLGKLLPPSGASGQGRLATLDDGDLLTRWIEQFDQEAHAGPLSEPTASWVERRVSAAQIWLWCDGGVAVSLAARSAPAAGVARIGPVYTPPAQRRRGYGAAVTAAATQAARDAGAEHVVLYTDLSNPTANSIYQSIGYVPDHDAENWDLVASPG